MGSSKVRFRPEARADLRNIHQRVLEFSRSRRTASLFVRRIVEACERLAGMPLAGRPRDDLEPGLRSFPFEKRAIIVYRVENDVVRIANVFYGGRDYEALYAEAIDDDAR